MSDLIKFLTRCLDEDERLATDAGQIKPSARRMGQHEPTWRARTDADGYDTPIVSLADAGDDVAEVIGDFPHEYARHIARHDPRSVLADIAAKRRIIELHEDDERGYCSAPCIGGWDWAEGVDYEEYPCSTIRALASAYAHRDGYREVTRADPENPGVEVEEQ